MAKRFAEPKTANDQTWRLFYFSITAVVVLMMMATVERDKLEGSHRLSVADAILVLKDKKVMIHLVFFMSYVAMKASFSTSSPLLGKTLTL